MCNSPGTCFVGWAGLVLTETHLPLPPELVLKACATSAQQEPALHCETGGYWGKQWVCNPFSSSLTPVLFL